MPISELYEDEPDDLYEAMERLRDILVRAEDKLASVCVYPASLSMYEFETRSGEVKQRRSTNGHMMPVAFVNFDGESLTLERYWYPKDELTKKEKHSGKRTFWHPEEPKFDDVLALELEDSFWVCEVVRLLPAMHDRLVEDAKVDPEEIRATTDKLNAWLATLREENELEQPTD